MKHRIAFVLSVSIPAITALVAIAYSLYTYETKAVRDAIEIAVFALVVAVPFCLFLWAILTLNNADERKAKDRD